MYEYKCKLIKVVDGDTVDVDIDLGFGVWLRKERVRIMGIDTPESRTSDKVEKVLEIFNACGVGAWAENLKAKYLQEAFDHLESIAVVSARKQPLIDLANYLMSRNK